MAFNPFHHFRRYSKVVFAILAIICMLTFVLSSGMGRGDALSQLTEWASGGGSGGTVLTLYGKKYDGSQVFATQRARLLASTYMELATGEARNTMQRAILTNLEKLPEQSRMLVGEIFQNYAQIMQNPTRAVMMLQQSVDAAAAQGRTDESNTLGILRNLISYDYMLTRRDPNEGYFGGNVKQEKAEEAADFLIWLHHADELGIRFTTADIKSAIYIETQGQLGADSAREIERRMRDQFREGYSIDSLYAALGDELRARAAREALTGDTQRTLSAVPAVLTPQQSWELFKDARTNLTVGLVDVPVQSFLDQVKATPTDDELQKLFNAHRNELPDPARPTPGFREPRRIGVEWVAASGDLPYYEKAAAKVAPLSAAIAQLGGALSTGLPGNSGSGVAEVVQIAAPLVFADAPIYSELSRYRDRELPWTENLGQRLHDSSVVRPENIAVLVGATAGGLIGGTPAALTGPLAYESRALRREGIDRSKIGLAMVGLAATEPQPWGIFGAPFEAMPKPLSLDVLRPALQEKARIALARKLVDADLLTFRAEVLKLGADSDKEKVKKYIAEFVKERGLTHATTTEPRSQFELTDDTGLAPLKAEYAKALGLRDPLLRGFAADFFNERSIFGEAGGVYTPRTFFGGFGGDDQKSYLYWLTEDREARTQSFTKARPLVEAAWKELQARELAKKEAERLAGLARAKQGNADELRMALRDLAVANGDRPYFELGPMARLMPQVSPIPGQPRQYTQFVMPPDRIPYPGAELPNDLLALRDQSVGTAKVVSDQPKDHFYVASLLKLEEPTQEEFRRSYVHSMTGAPEYDPILAGLAGDVRSNYRRAVLEQLRAEANLVINKDAAVKPPPRPDIGAD